MSLKSLKNQTLRNKSTINSVNLTGGASTGPVITSIIVTDSNYNNLDDTAIVPAGGYAKLIGSGFASGCSAYFNGSSVTTTFVSATEVRVVIPATTAGTYNIMLFNPSAAGAIYLNLGISSAPTFTTSAGSLGTSYETTAVSTSIAATGDDPITYALYSGSLPTGVTLASNGTLSGTSPVEASSTTYSFVVQATDAQLQDTTRSFSLTISSDIVTWSTPAADYAHTLVGNSVMSNVSLSAASAAGYNITYAANTLPTGVSLSGNTIFGTPTVEQTVYTALTATAATTGRSATRYVSWSISLGDTYWKYLSLLLTGTPAATTFIADSSNNNLSLTLVGDTRPSNFNPYTPGYYSNYFDGTGDYLSVADSPNLEPGSSDWTIEMWCYPINSNATNGSILFSKSATSSYGSWSFGFAPTVNGSTLQILCSNTGSSWDIQLVSSVTFDSIKNKWNHVAATRSGSTFRLFLNGVQVQTATSALSLVNNTNSLMIGYVNYGSTEFPGYISNVRYVLGTAVYTAAFTPPTAPLTAIANTALLTCQSNRLIDNSLNNFVITKNGDTTVSGFTPFTPPTSVTVNNLYSTYFDGTGDYLTVPSNAGYAFGTGDFTVECWVYINVATSYSTLIDATGNAGAGNSGGWFLEYSATRGLSVYLGGGAANVQYATTPALGVWTHIAVTRSSSTMRFFINGVLNTTGTYTNNITQSSTVYIGAAGGNQFLLNGYLSNVRIVKGTAVYTANFTPPTAPLTAIANTSLLTCQDATIKDNSTNAFAITSFGQAQPIAQSPFTQTTTAVTTTYLGSGYFDGNDYISGSGAFAFGSSDFCIEAWGYWTSFNNGTYGAPIISIGRASPAAQITLRANKTSAITTTANYYSVDNGTFIPSAGFSSGVTAGTINLNTWTHFALTRQGSTFRMFINGVLVSTQTDATAFGTAFTLINIGSDTTPSSGYMTGWVTDARVVVGSAIYTASFDTPATPLTAVTNTKLLTLQTDQPASNKQFIDNSGNNFLITQAANTSQGTFSPYGANWSNYFDGTGDYLTAPTNTAFSLTGNFTIESWLYPTAFSNYKGIWSNTNAINATGFHYGLNAAGNIFIYYNSSFVVTSSNAMTLNAWNHVAVVRNSGVIYIYINGVLSTNSWTTSASFTNAACVIGTNPGPGTEYYSGYISNFRLVNGTALYTAAFTPPTTLLTAVAGTSLLTCQDNRLMDDSPNNFTITRAGDVSVQRFNPFSPVIQTPTTYSTFFDGTGDYLTTPASVNMNIGTGNFTVETWVFPTINSASQAIISFANTNIFYLNASGVPYYGIYFVGDYALGSTAVALNTWSHLAFVRSGTTITCYINGTSVGSITNSSSIGTSVDTNYIGSHRGGNYWNGYLSNTRVVKGTAVYTSAFTPSTTPLTAIANTSLLTCQSATHIDNSTNAFTITQAGDAIPRTQNPFGFTNNTGQDYTPALYGGSAYFDGTGDYLATPATGQFVATGDFTIQLSFYLTSLAATNHLIGNYTANAATDWILEVINTGVLQVFLDGSTQRLGHSGLTVGQWYHVSITRSGTTVTGRINGAPFNTTSTYTMSGTFGTATKAIYMGMRAGSSNPLFGYLSDVNLVNGTALYKGSFVPPLAPVTATTGTTLLLNMDKAGVVDSSRSVDLETLGDAKIVYENPYNGSYYSNYFDGSGDYLSAASNAAFALPGNFTYECWFNSDNTGTASQWVEVPVNDGFQIYYSGTQIFVSAYGVTALITYTYTMPASTWTHLAVVRNGTGSNNLVLYINGVSVATATTNVSFAQGAFRVGGASYIFKGYISNVRLVKGTAVYTTNFTPSTAPLTAISGTSLLTCQSKSFVDNSTNAFAITRNGDVTVKSQNPFRRNSGSSMFFDGTGDYLVSPSSAGNSLGTDFTVEAWVFPTVATGTYGLTVAGTYDGITNSGWSVIVNRSTGGPFGLAFIHGNALQSTYGTYLTVGAWTHIAVSRSGSSLRLFVNGVVVTTTTYATTDSIVSPLYVGSQGAGATLFTGYIADLRITDAARYTTAFTPSTTQFLTR